ncbi:MAG: YciI family protein [Bacteroidota bacterium]
MAQEYLLAFRFTPNAEYQPTEAEQQEQQQLWGAFIGGIASAGKLVSTNELGFEGINVHPDQSTDEGIAVLDNQTLGGYMVITADSIAEASELAKGCPILGMGGSVEVRNIVPMEH